MHGNVYKNSLAYLAHFATDFCRHSNRACILYSANVTDQNRCKLGSFTIAHKIGVSEQSGVILRQFKRLRNELGAPIHTVRSSWGGPSGDSKRSQGLFHNKTGLTRRDHDPISRCVVYHTLV